MSQLNQENTPEEKLETATQDQVPTSQAAQQEMVHEESADNAANAALCAKCHRALSTSSGTCYYCREVPKEMEMDIKLKMVEMERQQQARSQSDSLFLIAKGISALVGVAFVYCAFSKHFPNVSMTFLSICGFMLLVNSWTLDKNILKTMSFCILSAAVSAMYSLSLAIPFLVGEGRNLMLMFTAVFLAMLAAVPGLIVMYLVEKERRD